MNELLLAKGKILQCVGATQYQMTPREKGTGRNGDYFKKAKTEMNGTKIKWFV